MATIKELAIKFSEQGLTALKANIDADSKKIGTSLDQVVTKARDVGTALAALKDGQSLDGIKIDKVDTSSLVALEAEAKKHAKRMSNAVRQSFKNLRVESESDLDKLRTKAQQSFTAIKESGLASTQDIARAQRALSRKLIDLDPIEAAYRELGVTSTAVLQQMRSSAFASFAEISASGKASLTDIRNASLALGGKLIDTDPTIAAMRKMRLVSGDEVKKLVKSIGAEFDRAALEGKGSAEAIAEAYKRAQAQISSLTTTKKAQAPRPEAMDTLKLVSQQDLNRQKKAVIDAYREMRIAAKEAGNDKEFTRLHRTALDALRKISAEARGPLKKALKDSKKPLNELSDAFSRLGVASRAEFDKTVAQVQADLARITNSAKSSAKDIENANVAAAAKTAAAWRKLNGNQNPFEVLGIETDKALDKMVTNARAAFAKIEQFQSPESIERARKALRQLESDIERKRKGGESKSDFDLLGLPDPADVERKRKAIIRAHRSVLQSVKGNAKATRAATDAHRRELRKLEMSYERVAKSARKTRGPIRALNGLLASLAFETTGALFAVAAIGAGLTLPFRTVGNTIGKLQKLEVQLQSLNKTAEATKTDMAFIEDFAFGGKQPFSLDPLLSAFTNLKANGIEPANGALRTFVDAISATKGVDPEALKNASKAIGQIAAKGKVASEELRQQLAESLPGAMRHAADAMGVTAAELEKKLVSGLGAKEFLVPFFEHLEKMFKGAGQRSLNTWDGIFESMKQTWDRFVISTGRAGMFDAMIAQLVRLQAQIAEWDQDGTLDRFAESMSAALTSVMNGFVWLVEVVAEHGETIKSIFKTLAAAYVGSKIFAIFAGLGVLLGKLTSALRIARVASAGFGAALMAVGRTALLAGGPAGWLIGGLLWGVYELATAWGDASKEVENYLEKQNKLGNVTSVNKLNRSIREAQDEIALLQESLDKLLTKRAVAREKPAYERLKGGRETEHLLDDGEGERIKALQDQIGDVSQYLDKALIKLGKLKLKKKEEGSFDNLKDSIAGAKNQQLKLERELARAIKDIRARTLADLKNDLDDQLIAHRTYIDKRQAIELAAITQQLAAKRKALASAETEPAKEKLRVDIGILEGDKGEIRKRSIRELRLYEEQQARETSQLKIELLELEQKTGEATALRLVERFRKQRKALEVEKKAALKANDFDAFLDIQTQIDLIIKVTGKTQAIAEFDAVETAIGKLMAEQARQEQQLQVERDAGLRSEMGMRQALLDIHQKTYQQMGPLVAKARELAEASGDAGLLERIKDMQAALALLADTTDQAAVRIKDSAEGGLVDMFDDVMAGAKSASEAFEDFGNTVIATIRRILAEQLVENLLGGMLKNFGTGISSFLPGKATGGPIKRATGGLINGAGTGTSDSIGAALEPNSFVLRAAAVRKYGASMLDQLRFAAGGAVPALVSNGEYYLGADGVEQHGSGLLNAINTMRIHPDRLADYLGGVSRFATGGMVTDSLRVQGASSMAKPSQAIPTGQSAPSTLRLEVSENALQMTVRDLLEREFSNIAAVR